MRFKVHTDFLGSQDGISATAFRAGEEAEISDHLAPHIGAWADPIEETPPDEARADDEGADAAPIEPKRSRKPR